MNGNIRNWSGLCGACNRSDFSFDAMSVYWRVAADCILNPRPRACSDSAGISNIHDMIAEKGQIYARYDIFSGQIGSDIVSLSFYGSFLPGMRLHFPTLAESFLKSELSQSRIRPILNDPDRYYDLNWIWFGLAADSGLIKEMTPDPQWIRTVLAQ
ncbi:hypothetical protein [Desulfonatronovibrio magnus]|uniref:hypothetical protein n=1 Tax=Desulfonatronovibrio magnus TaxID=698827 RepID=UPI0005EBD633|nr:hypothetical protein [Desulfonatronovibrio magnus]